MELELVINQDNVIEEINTFILSMPMEYALGHCVSKDMSMSAGIATYFKLLNNLFNNYLNNS